MQITLRYPYPDRLRDRIAATIRGNETEQALIIVYAVAAARAEFFLPRQLAAFLNGVFPFLDAALFLRIGIGGSQGVFIRQSRIYRCQRYGRQNRNRTRSNKRTTTRKRDGDLSGDNSAAIRSPLTATVLTLRDARLGRHVALTCRALLEWTLITRTHLNLSRG